jgi:hypothetical protein
LHELIRAALEFHSSSKLFARRRPKGSSVVVEVSNRSRIELRLKTLSDDDGEVGARRMPRRDLYLANVPAIDVGGTNL